METAIVENGYIKVTKDGRFFRTYDNTECPLVVNEQKGRKYYTVTYTRNGYGEVKYAHRLYADAFIPNDAGDDAIVLARDGNHLNLSTENLYWSNKKDNFENLYVKLKENAPTCVKCGKKIWKMKDVKCSYCKTKEYHEAISDERKKKRIEKYKKEFQYVDMDVLPTREADMVNMRIKDCTLEEIGNKYGLTKEGVRQILNKVKKKF